MKMLQELMAITEGGVKDHLMTLVDKAIKETNTKGMTYEDAVDAIADKVREYASKNGMFVGYEIVDMIKDVYDDELNEEAEANTDEMIAKADSYRVLLNKDSEQITLMDGKTEITSMPLVIWKQLTRQ